MGKPRLRNFCFTDFKLRDWNKIWNEHQDDLRYLVIGDEICPTTGRQHYQGWLQIRTSRTKTAIAKRLGVKDMWMMGCFGDEYSNEKYCGKDKKFTKWGEFIIQGQRRDLEEIKNEIVEGKTIEEVAIEHPEMYCRYRNGLKDIAGIIAKRNSKKFREVEVVVLYGDTGTGKTRTAMEHAEYKIEGDNLDWWDGYNGEETILIDEYDTDVKITKMLNLLDGYQLRLPIKGGFTYANWTKVYITSNVHPDNWHLYAKDAHKEALKRRITHVIGMFND